MITSKAIYIRIQMPIYTERDCIVGLFFICRVAKMLDELQKIFFWVSKDILNQKKKQCVYIRASKTI